MAAYITTGHLKQYLDQFKDTTEHDDALENVIARASAIVNSIVGTPSNLTAADAGTQVVYGDGSLVLELPPHTTGSVTSVTAPSGYTVPTYIQQDGALVIVSSDGVVLSPFSDYTLSQYRYNNYALSQYGYGWLRGVPYTVAAAFGYGADVMAVLEEATLQTAVQLWRYKDAGGSETIGAEGAIITVKAGLTPLIRESLEAISRQYSGNRIGVY